MKGKLRDENGNVVCERCALADGFFSRIRGLLGRDTLAAGEGLLLTPENSIHTWFMRFPIDVVFLDRELRVLAVRPDVRPWGAAARRGAHAALELAAGEAARQGLEEGDELRLE